MRSPTLSLLAESLSRRRIRRRDLARIRRRAASALKDIARLTSASVLAYLLGKALIPGGTDLTGPLTALLVVQTSLYATLRMSLLRIAAVLTGVFLAIVVSSWVGLSWASLGLVIASALIAGHLLRLRDSLLEAPISAMLILGVSQHETAAGTRVLNTLVGAGVGVAFTLLFPPPIAAQRGADAVREVADATAGLLRRAGNEIVERVDADRLSTWRLQTHELAPLVLAADGTVAEVEERRKLNPRSLARANVVPSLRSGLAALESTVLSLRVMFETLQDHLPPSVDPSGPGGGRAAGHDGSGDADRIAAGHDEELRGAFSVVLLDMADAAEAFGTLVVAEAEGRRLEAEDALAETLEILRETRAILTELYFVDGRDDPSTWLLHGSVLAAIEGVLSHLDVEERARRRSAAGHGKATRPSPMPLPLPLARYALGYGTPVDPASSPPADDGLWPSPSPDDPAR